MIQKQKLKALAMQLKLSQPFFQMQKSMSANILDTFMFNNKQVYSHSPIRF